MFVTSSNPHMRTSPPPTQTNTSSAHGLPQQTLCRSSTIGNKNNTGLGMGSSPPRHLPPGKQIHCMVEQHTLGHSRRARCHQTPRIHNWPTYTPLACGAPRPSLPQPHSRASHKSPKDEPTDDTNHPTMPRRFKFDVRIPGDGKTWHRHEFNNLPQTNARLQSGLMPRRNWGIRDTTTRVLHGGTNYTMISSSERRTICWNTWHRS